MRLLDALTLCLAVAVLAVAAFGLGALSGQIAYHEDRLVERGIALQPAAWWLQGCVGWARALTDGGVSW